MSAGDTAREHYTSARTELIQRIHLRDNVLLVYLGAVGTVFGLAFGTSIRSEVLLVVPFFSLGASVILSQHNIAIGSIGAFLVHEIEPFLKQLGEYAPQWDNSVTFHEYSSRGVWLRTIGHTLLIVIPAIAGIAITWRSGFYSPFPQGPLWWFALICTVLSCYFIWYAHTWRNKIYAGLKWRTSKKN
jgi:hypothetical protein